MNYQETCEYLYNQMPMFERQGASGYKEGLDNTWSLDEHFGHPHQHYATIHVAGTNGKGSVSHTIAAVLQSCGYKVGLYTSPHLVDFRERIRVNGDTIPEQYVVEFVEKERAFFEPLHPSFFEVATAMAFKYFADCQIDIAVVEVGLGGRLDCTNIITPLLSVITNISYDHTQFLGDTLEKIAGEKAGIIKREVPVIIGESSEATRPVFESKAEQVGCPITFADDEPVILEATPSPTGGMHYLTQDYGSFDGDLGGLYQAKNMNTVLCALKVLEQKGYLMLKPSDGKSSFRQEITNAFSQVAKLTGLMGRWQTVATNPQIVCDTGHNVGGWEYLSQQLDRIQCKNMHIIFGMVDDKDIDHVLEMLPKRAHYYFTQAATKRAVNANVVMTIAAKQGLSGNAYPSVYEAYKAASAAALADDFIFVGGSSYVVGDFLKNCF